MRSHIHFLSSMDRTCLVFIVFLLCEAVLHVCSQDCPQPYKRYSASHTFCKKANPTCKILHKSVEPTNIPIILNVHNSYRSKVAIGKETTGNLPKASNMLQMEWDDELATIAQKHAEQCKWNHDCEDCKRVRNFGVGQNLYKQTAGNRNPVPNWTAAIKSWYDEVSIFNKNYISPFVPASGEPSYGHFTQVVWADSWKIGCGYVVFEENNKYVSFYVCNYGPGGNVRSGDMYKKGNVCSNCPINSCCDKTCRNFGLTADYPGLCKKTDNQAPKYKTQEEYIFHCDFQNEPDCESVVTEGSKKWQLSNTLSGKYMGIVLNGGESSKLTFTIPFKAKAKSSICFMLYYRKGANVAGQEVSNKAIEKFVIVDNNYEVETVLRNNKVKFEKFSMQLGWNMKTKFSIAFSVPGGKPAQYLEIKNLGVKDGDC